MIKKPAKGQKLLLLCYSQVSRTGFMLPVECVASEEPKTGQKRSKAEVWVMLADASVVIVTRADVEDAES